MRNAKNVEPDWIEMWQLKSYVTICNIHMGVSKNRGIPKMDDL